MSESFDMEFSGFHTVEGLRTVVGNIKEKFPSGDHGVTPDYEDPLFLHFTKLDKQALQSVPNFSSLLDFTIEGKLGVKPIPWVDIVHIFEGLDDQIKSDGACFVTIGYEEKNSHQSRFGYDSISVAIKAGVACFYFDANGSLPCVDRAYGYSIIKSLVNFLGFYITVEGGEKDYRLSDNKGRLTVLAGGALGENPSAFAYTLDSIDSKKTSEFAAISLRACWL